MRPFLWIGAAVFPMALAAPGVAFAEPSSRLDSETETALAALRDLTPHEQESALAEMRRARRAGQMGATQIPLVAGLIQDSPWSVAHRRRLAFLLAALGEKAKPTLEHLASSPDETVQSAARDGLQFQALVAPLASPQAEARLAALRGLPEFAAAHREAAELTLELLGDAYGRKDETRRDVRLTALRSLMRFGEPAAAELVRSLENPDPFYYEYGQAALRAMGAAANDAILEGLQHRSPLVRQRAIHLLLETGIDDDVAAAIQPLVNDRDELVRKAAARAIAAHRARGAAGVGR